MTGRLWVTEGVVSARVEAGGLIDAAVSGDMAGLELEVTDATVHIGPRTDHRGDCTVSLSMSPPTMAMLMTVLAHRLDLPAFNEREWRTIARGLRVAQAQAASAESWDELADRIEKAL